MKKNFNGKIALLALCAAICAAAVLGCNRQERNEQDQASKAEHEWQNKLGAFAKRNGAVRHFETQIPERGVARVFSIDVSRALIQSNGQPVVITMDLKDVAENNGGYTALFGKSGTRDGLFTLISVELKCTQKQANYLLERTGKDFSQTYAVVARFDEVVRPKFKVSGSGVSGSEDGEDSSPIELDDSCDVFLIKGVCVDLLRKDEIK